ncbi:Putative ribonuclease H protein family [Arachis hypogaea]|nr:Putative ribonuclease H protein family [Arachis hypogaea]
MLRSKYKCGNNILPNVNRKSNASNLWKEVCSAWSDVKRNTTWRIGNGSEINFWDHNWVLKLGWLDQYATQVINTNVSNVSQNEFLSISGGWDEEKLKKWLQEEAVGRILAIAPLSPWKGSDRIAWEFSSYGTFSLKTAYNSLEEDPSLPD